LNLSNLLETRWRLARDHILILGAPVSGQKMGQMDDAAALSHSASLWGGGNPRN